MKKSLIILISLLGLFFFIPFVNFARAVPPDYIGVQVGEEYVWTIRVDVTGYTQYVTDLGGTVDPSFSTMFATMPEIETKGVIEWISDEVPGINFTHVIINMSVYMNVPGYGWMSPMPPGEYLPVIVLSNTTSNYFNSTMTAMMTEPMAYPFYMMMPFIIVPHNLNWTEAVAGLNAVLDQFMMGVTGVTFTEVGRGFTISIPAQNVGGYDIQQTDYTAQWSEKGVFAQGGMSYAGASVITVNIPAEGIISGFEIAILLGILGTTTVGIIYYIKKRK